MCVPARQREPAGRGGRDTRSARPPCQKTLPNRPAPSTSLPTVRLSDADLARAVATAVKALRDEFKAVSAPLAAAALAANAEAAAAAATAAAARAPPRGRATLPATAAEARPSGGPPPVTLRVLKPASGGGAAPSTSDGGGAATVTAQPRTLPRSRAADKPPPFKAWTYVTRNEAAAQGGRLFYTDAETNETVPVSDSSDDDDDDDSDASDDDAVAAAAAATAAASPAAALALDGLTRERDVFTMLGVAASFGCGPRVAAALAEQLDAPDLAKAVGGRLAAAAAWMDARAAEQARSDAAAASEDALPPTTPTDTLGRVLCRQCRVYACALHADSSAAVRAARAAVAAAGAGGSRGGTPDGDEPCSEACYRAVDVGGGRERVAAAVAAAGRGGAAAAAAAAPSRRRRAPGLTWTPAETALVTRAVTALGRGDVCAVAAAVPTRTCSAVATWLAAHPDAAAVRGVNGMVPVAALAAAEAAGGAAASCARGGVTTLTAGRGRGPPSRGRGRGRGARALANVRKKHEDSLWEPYTPCACGPAGCSPKCPCFASKNYCEKFCGCPPSCGYRFKGCVCKSGCRTQQCPCIAALRECNPDVCKFCGVAEGASTARVPPRVALAAASAPPALAPPPDPTNGPAECSNMRLRLRQHKRVAAGASAIDGWGAFLLEPARKGDLIGEYCGELVSHAEADRRGKAYDRDDSSYLFNLTSDAVVDARTAGSKLRFANHAPGSDANCRPKVVLVDGDSRVGIYASRDLPAGAELTFDYQYEDDRAPAWCTR